MFDSRFQNYLEVVPLWQIALTICAFAVISFGTPRKYRLGVSIVAMMVWLSLDRYTGLGPLSTMAKTTYSAVYLMVGLAAVLHPGPRRHVSIVGWLYVVLALLGFIYVGTVIDVGVAMARRFAWLLLTLTAILVVRTIVDRRSLQYIFTSFAVGAGCALLIPLSALIIDPQGSFAGWLRFRPYGANPNQIGLIFVQATFFSTCMIIGNKRIVSLSFYVVIAGISAALAITTFSRNVIILLGLLVLPPLLAMLRRPLAMFPLSFIVVVIVSLIISFVPTMASERLLRLTFHRMNTLEEYFRVVMDRPVFGLLGTQDQISTHDLEIGTHAHNAYAEQLYVGGVSYAGPLFFLVAYSLVCCARTWLGRKTCPFSTFQIGSMAVLLLCVYIHGLINAQIYHATDSWAFLHVMVAVWFMTTAERLKVTGGLVRSGHRNRSVTTMQRWHPGT